MFPNYAHADELEWYIPELLERKHVEGPAVAAIMGCTPASEAENLIYHGSWPGNIRSIWSAADTRHLVEKKPKLELERSGLLSV